MSNTGGSGKGHRRSHKREGARLRACFLKAKHCADTKAFYTAMYGDIHGCDNVIVRVLHDGRVQRVGCCSPSDQIVSFKMLQAELSTFLALLIFSRDSLCLPPPANGSKSGVRRSSTATHCIGSPRLYPRGPCWAGWGTRLSYSGAYRMA